MQRYEPALRRAVRFRLFDPRMRRVLDSQDICQSVLASFFIRLVAGDYELEQPEHLLALLQTMARNKVISKARKLAPEVARQSPAADEPVEPDEIVGRDPSPSKQVVVRELLDQFQRRLQEDEQELLLLRQEGLSWEEIAARLGGTAVNLRKKWSRARERVERELGLAEESHA